MSVVKKITSTPGDSKLEQEAKKFNKRALIGSVIIHLFFFLLRLPHLELEHKLKDDPKLIPITITAVTPPAKSSIIKNKLVDDKAKKNTTIPTEEKINNGTENVVKNSTGVGNALGNKDTKNPQKGDPASRVKEAYKEGTDFRKTPKNTVGTGSAPGKTKSKDGNTGGQGDTYGGKDLTNLTDGLIKKGKGLQRLKVGNHADDGGAGGGKGGGLGSGEGGGNGSGFFTGTTTGTTNPAKMIKNTGSLSGAAKGEIDSGKGFEGLASKGSVSVPGIPAEKVALSIINPDEIRRLLREHIPQFRYCYQNELDRSKNVDGVSGRVNFRFKIGPGGKVVSSNITSEDFTSDKVRDCIKDVLHGITFPSPAGGKTVEVSQPMNFYAKRI